jgi:hypothetical protein
MDDENRSTGMLGTAAERAACCVEPNVATPERLMRWPAQNTRQIDLAEQWHRDNLYNTPPPAKMAQSMRGSLFFWCEPAAPWAGHAWTSTPTAHG